MAIRERARLFCLFATGTVVCAAQQDQRTTAMQWADHYAAVYQVPRELVHSIIEIESDWRPRVISNKGAVGLMQLMPATALTFGVTNRFEIEQNIRGGVAYLKDFLAWYTKPRIYCGLEPDSGMKLDYFKEEETDANDHRTA